VRFLLELGQLALALVISGVVASFVGPTYVAVSLLVTATCMVLLLDSAHRASAITEKPVDAIEVAGIAGTAFMFGLIWPAIPLIFTWKRATVDG